MPQVSKIVRMSETDRRKFQALYDRLPTDRPVETKNGKRTNHLVSPMTIPGWR